MSSAFMVIVWLAVVAVLGFVRETTGGRHG